MFWMLVVETIAKIRRLSLVQGKSIKAICRGVEGLPEGGAQGAALGRDGVPLRAQAPSLSPDGRLARGTGPPVVGECGQAAAGAADADPDLRGASRPYHAAAPLLIR